MPSWSNKRLSSRVLHKCQNWCVFVNSCCFVSVCSSPAPGQVKNLKLEAVSEKMLHLSWSPPDGHWDFYRVLLFNGSSVLVNRTISRNVVEFGFGNWTLIPGRVYGAAVSAQSGSLRSTAHCQHRLGGFTKAHLIDSETFHVMSNKSSMIWKQSQQTIRIGFGKVCYDISRIECPLNFNTMSYVKSCWYFKRNFQWTNPTRMV